MLMPQIWMTYEELAEMLDCTVVEARDRAHVECLDRKISRDGQKRAKLSEAMAAVFVDQIRTSTYSMDQAVDGLKSVHDLMKQKDSAKSRQLLRTTSK
jgi:hypothetical protein